MTPNVYSDNVFFDKEQHGLFLNEPLYIGHSSMLPNIGDYLVSTRFNNELIFIRNQSGIECIQNICKHHQALILKNSGKISSITCPFHRWTYDLNGKLINAPFIDELPCIALKKLPLHEWNNFYFIQKEPQIKLIEKNLSIFSNLNRFKFDSTETLFSSYNWKIFIENYLDDYHVPAIHPGLRSLVDIHHLSWEFSENFSLQIVNLHNKLKESKSQKFNQLKKAIEKISKQIPLTKVVWMTIYPATMIEIYPYMITISTLKPISINETINHVDFFFNQDAISIVPDYVEIAK